MKKMLSSIKKVVKGAGEKNLSVYAAASAFFWILSAAPVMVVISCVIPYTSLTREVLTGFVVDFLPETVEDYVIELIYYIYTNNKGVLPVALFLAVWSAGRGMLSLIHGFNGIYGMVEKRGYFKLRLVASFYTVVMLAGMLFALLLLVFGQSIYEAVFIQIPVFREASYVVLRVRYIIAVLVLSVIFTMLYTFVPNNHTSLRNEFSGGVMAALGCTVFSFGFSIYIDYFNDYSAYGSIRMIVIMMLWLYFMVYIVLYGAYLGSYIHRRDRI